MASTSMAATATLMPCRLPSTTTTNYPPRCSSLPSLPPLLLSTPAFSTSLKQLSQEAVEDKSTVILYGGGAIVAVWLSSIFIGAINSVPLLPKLMELVRLGYTGWFVYRYLLFKDSRKEIATDIESLKKFPGTE